MKVLVVDDNRLDRMMLSKMLSSNNYVVVEAGNGVEALKLVSLEKPDIVVSDIMMPEMDGFTLLREIRKSISSKELPFIFYSASYVTEKDMELAEALGVCRFIIKPIEPRELVKEITQALLDISSGKLKISQPTPIKEEEYLERYSRRIFNKLEEKVSQLEREIEERKRIEEKLRKSEAKFKATFKEAPIGMSRVDSQGRILETNHILQQMLGFMDEEIKGKLFTEFTYHDDVELDIDQFNELILGNKDQYMIKKRYIRKNGMVFWARMTVSLVRDIKGDPQFAIIMVEDITERKEAEEKLHQSEEKYRTLIEHIQDGVFIIINGKFQFVNEAFARLAGYEVEEIIGMDFRQFIAPEDMAKVSDYYIRRQAGENVPTEYEFNALHRDRKTRLILNMTVALINFGGKVATMGTLKDITERRKAEEKLRLFRTLFETSTDAVFIDDPETGLIIDCNETACKNLGYSIGEILNMHVFDFEAAIPDKFSWEDHVKDLMKKRNVTMEGLHKRKDGSVFPVEVNTNILDIGQKSYTMAVVRDITERKHAEELLHQSKEFSETVLNSINDLITIINVKDFTIIDANKAFLKFYNLTKEQAIGKNCYELTHNSNHPCPLDNCPLQNTLKTGSSSIYEHIHYARNGNIQYVEVSAYPINNENGEIGSIVHVTRDITERKNAEKLQKEKARAELHGFIVSALPVFASGVPSQVRDILIKNFSERFEMNVKPRFKEEMKQKDVNHDPSQLITAYMVWVSGLFSNFGIENKRTIDGKKEVLEFINCPWRNEAHSNPIFCFICRSLAKRSFTWTGLKGSVEQKSSIASGSKMCRFEIQVRDEKK
ncbi:MAG: PAS domain S-box protein [Candidatus Methanoperedens sp.]|nr:PAS domain S-box protein [Candidatus Methanoperedens sp.]